jgi:hypothetical protein
MCEKHSRFTLSHASLNPYLSLRHLKIDQVSDDVFHITAVVENNGFLPTYTSKKALERKAVRPIEVELVLPEGVSIVNGKRTQEIGQLEGRSNKLWAWFNSHPPTDNRAKIEWVLQGPRGASLELTVRSQRAGFVRRTFGLENNTRQ